MLNRNKIMQKAPIVIFVYKRPEHTEKVLEGLKRNNIQKLYIFADGAKTEKDKLGVAQVRDLINNIDWCETEIIASHHNKGLSESIFYGYNFIFDKHDRIITIEDDCVPADDFVNFMDQCLEKYQNDPEVMSIAGHAMPIKYPKDYNYDIYFSHRSNCYGFATWKRAWDSFRRDPNDISKLIHGSSLRKQLDLAGKDLFYMFQQQLNKEIDSFYIWWNIYIAKVRGVTIYPIASRVQNIGFDGTGRNCDGAKSFWTEIDNTRGEKPLDFPETTEANRKIHRTYYEYVYGSFLERIKWKIEGLLGVQPKAQEPIKVG